MKERLIIIGAGNVGGFLSYNIDSFGNYDVLGFLDDDPGKHGKEIYGRKVLGNVDSVVDYLGDQPLKVVIGIASPSAKAKVAQEISKLPVSFPNFISDRVWLSNSVEMGIGVILYPGTSVNYETYIGNFVIVNMNCAIGHNCKIENYSTLAPGVNLAGFTHLEERVTLGIGVSTKQKITIGRSAIIGGQSMLTKDVDNGALIAGVPGKDLRA